MRIPSGTTSDNEAKSYGPHVDYHELEEPREEGGHWPSESHGDFRKSSASRNSFEDAQNEAQARTEGEEGAAQLAARSRYCPRRKAFYRCANGFVGCCSHDPCNPGETCRDRAKASHKKEKSKSATHTHRPSTHVTGHGSHTRSHDTPIATPTSAQQTSTISHTDSSQGTSTSSKTPILTDSSTGSTPSTTSSAPIMSGTPPACPGGNGTLYTDSTKVEYQIFCGMENTFESYNSIYISTGGYGQCFLVCSQTDKCAGFTFVKSDSGSAGNCYEHTQMPNNTYVQHDDENLRKFVTATKVDSPDNQGTGRNSTSQKKGIIAGAIIGTIFLIVIIFIIIFCWRRRKNKKIEQRRATTMIQATQPQRPIELQQYPSTANPQRQGSTSHDFQPYRGGASPGYFNTPTKAQSQNGTASPPALVGLEQTLKEDTNPEMRPESGIIPMMLPTSTYQAMPNPEPKALAGAPSARLRGQTEQQSGGQRWASTIESPTLGQQSNYNKSPPPMDGNGIRWREI